jgi:hypothetical protein
VLSLNQYHAKSNNARSDQISQIEDAEDAKENFELINDI